MSSECETQEEWRTVDGFDGRYEVSSLGRVRSFFKSMQGVVMKSRLKAKGYRELVLSLNNKPHYRSVHRMVARAFVPNPDGKPQVSHLNGDPGDNRAENLAWVTQSENEQHKIAHGRSGIRPKLTPEQVVAIREMFPIGERRTNRNQAAAMFGVSPATLCKVIYYDTYRSVSQRPDTGGNKSP